MPTVSGEARGIDETAMLSALEHQGTAIGVLADRLLRAATSAKYRKHLMVNNLVLVSPFNPEAGFNVGNAMARNRHIYCLADAAVVVSSTRDKGGTICTTQISPKMAEPFGATGVRATTHDGLRPQRGAEPPRDDADRGRRNARSLEASGPAARPERPLDGQSPANYWLRYRAAARLTATVPLTFTVSVPTATVLDARKHGADRHEKEDGPLREFIANRTRHDGDSDIARVIEGRIPSHAPG
jgi:hypothetical protein